MVQVCGQFITLLASAQRSSKTSGQDGLGARNTGKFLIIKGSCEILDLDDNLGLERLSTQRFSHQNKNVRRLYTFRLGCLSISNSKKRKFL